MWVIGICAGSGSVYDCKRLSGRLQFNETAFVQVQSGREHPRTVVGNRAQLENKTGLTLVELLEVADRYPEAKTFDGVTREEIMEYLMMLNEDTFIDWDTGNCHFDSEIFKEVLEFVNRFLDSAESGKEEKSLPTKIQSGEVLLAIAEMNTL